MVDSTVRVKEAAAGSGTKLVDNEQVTNENGDVVQRQRITSVRYNGGKEPAVGVFSTAGLNTLKAPAAGKALRLYWIYFVQDPEVSSYALITILLGTRVLYKGYALSHWEVFDGAVDEQLKVELSANVGGDGVAVTAHYQEFTP